MTPVEGMKARLADGRIITIERLNIKEPSLLLFNGLNIELDYHWYYIDVIDKGTYRELQRVLIKEFIDAWEIKRKYS